MSSGTASSTGWYGDSETNIPALLFPKHVLGLHASDDLAFYRDFEAVHSASRRLQQTVNGRANGHGANGSAASASAASANGAAATFPDILNGGRGKIHQYNGRMLTKTLFGNVVLSLLLYSTVDATPPACTLLESQQCS